MRMERIWWARRWGMRGAVRVGVGKAACQGGSEDMVAMEMLQLTGDSSLKRQM